MTAARLKAEGVKPGVPDLFLPIARDAWHGLFVELKRVSGGRVSPAQTAWITLLRLGRRAGVDRRVPARRRVMRGADVGSFNE